MRKMISVFLVAMAVALFSLASAAELYPRLEGNDVLVPDRLIKAIPGYSAETGVYVATDLNGWFVRGSKFTSPEVLEATGMLREGGDGNDVVWRAKGMKGRRFHPVQLDEAGKPKWALIEEVYPLESEFVDNKGSGPCLLVK